MKNQKSKMENDNFLVKMPKEDSSKNIETMGGFAPGREAPIMLGCNCKNQILVFLHNPLKIIN
jgi:hypothetical protein